MLAKTPREASGTQDITGGLPRVTEIFEARKPKDPAIMAEIDGKVELLGEKRRGKRTIVVKNESGIEREHLVTHGKHLRVHAGDYVKAGEALVDGPLVPHDILRISGEEEVQQYLVREIQNVYRSQRVDIDDKHIEIIVSQMLRKVKIETVGDTNLLPGQRARQVRVPAGQRAASPTCVRITDKGDSEFAVGSVVPKDVLAQANAQIEALGGTPAKGGEAEAGDGQHAAARDHQGERAEFELHLGGELPGDHEGAHRGGPRRQGGQPRGPQGERDPRPPDPGRHGLQHVPVVGGARAARGPGVAAAGSGERARPAVPAAGGPAGRGAWGWPPGDRRWPPWTRPRGRTMRAGGLSGLARAMQPKYRRRGPSGGGPGWSASMARARLVSCRLVCVRAAWLACPSGQAQIAAYNPYADSQENLPPVAPDGTLRWGTFYKSAAIQKAYERLWNLGDCRGTNKAITVPVEMNKVAIDSLPEEEFRGVVVGATGTIRGGMIAFSTAADPADDSPNYVAALHPAGVSKLTVSGSLPAAALRPGLTVRLQARVDRRGVAAEPLTILEVITPPSGFKPGAIEPERDETIVGTVTRLHGGTLHVQVAAGKIRRLSIPLAADAAVRVDAGQLDLVAPGDVSLTGRVWRGEGCVGEGTVFAPVVTVIKPVPVAAAPAVDERLGA